MTAGEYPLQGVEALTFDIFGTVANWHGSIVRELKARAAGSTELNKFTDGDWSDFAREWREGFLAETRRLAAGGAGSLNVDVIHRQFLDGMLASNRWSPQGAVWGESDRQELTQVWHRLDGWPDSSNGLHALKKRFLIATLPNGSVRLLADMAKHANLPWDVIFAAELFGAYKPDPKVYLGAMHHLSVRPDQCCMVAAHIYDVRAAAKEGMHTVYVRRSTEDTDEERASAKPKAEGGEFDLVVDSLEELAELLGCT